MGIWDTNTRILHGFLYSEYHGAKKPDEISSILYKYINAVKQPDQHQLKIWGDNCTGKIN
jgi:hypothetical protein